MTEALCVICATDLAAPLICQRCENRIRRDLDDVGRMRKALHEWDEIDPGTPGRDEPHRLALLDNPVVTASGNPDLSVIAATDVRTRRIIRDWHDAQCTAPDCTTPDCANPDHREDPADDVVNIDWELITEAARISEARRLSSPIRDVFDAIRIITISFDWSTRSDRVDDYAAIIQRCAQALRGILHDTTDRIIGECTAAHHERDTCGGPLRFAWIGPLSIEPASQIRPTHIQCSWCKDLWPCDAATLIGMLRVTTIRHPIPVPRGFAADVCGVRLKTLHEWVRRGHVTAYPGTDLVDLSDVLQKADQP